MFCRLPLPILIFSASILFAHPMGNFSVSHYTRLEATASGLRLRYALDLAEIPTFELLRQWGVKADGPRAQLEEQAAGQMREWAKGLEIWVGGKVVTPVVRRTTVRVSEGAGQMVVMRVQGEMEVVAGAGAVTFEDRNYAERAGWKEIVIAGGAGVSLTRASQGAVERSAGLTKYPEDATMAPPQDLRAEMVWTVAKVAEPVKVAPVAQPEIREPVVSPAAVKAPGEVAKGDYLSELLGKKEISGGLLLAGLAVAFGFGAMHAMAPGHGKTIVAAYLVGARGTFRHAILLGGMVTLTHTISVFGLGMVTLYLSQYVMAAQLVKTLGVVSSASIVLVGVWLLLQRTGVLDHGHSHEVDEVGGGSLVALAVSGGMVPCPSALILLLSAISVERTGFGLLLLVAFSLGLASVLMAIGVAVLYAKNLLPEAGGWRENWLFRAAPVVSAGVIVVVGLVMTGISLR